MRLVLTGVSINRPPNYTRTSEEGTIVGIRIDHRYDVTWNPPLNEKLYNGRIFTDKWTFLSG